MSAGTSVAASRPFGRRALLTLAAFAAGLLLARAALRGIHVPGHTALPALFFLVLAVQRVRRTGAAVIAAAPTMLASQLGLVGDAGGAATLALTACLVEAAAVLAPRFSERVFTCALVGLGAGVARLVPQLVAQLAGVPDTGAPLPASIAGYAAFGALGAALAAATQRLPVPRRG